MLLLLFAVAILLIAATGLYAIIVNRNLIRVLIGMELLVKAVTLLLAVAGERAGKVELAQSFIIALIIVEVVVTAVGAGIAVALQKRNGTLDLNKMDHLKG